MHARCLLVLRCMIVQVLHGVTCVITSNGSNYADTLRTLDGGVRILTWFWLCTTCMLETWHLHLVGKRKPFHVLTKHKSVHVNCHILLLTI